MIKRGVIVASIFAAIPASSFAAEITAAKIELDGENRVVCRRMPETGSLTKVTKICRKRKDWKVARDDMRREMEQFTTSAPGQSN